MDIERNVDKRGEPVVSDCCPFLKHAAIEPGMLRSIAGLSEPPFGAIKMARGCGIGVEFLPSSGGTLRASVAADDDGRPVVRVAEGQDAEQSNWIVACALASLALLDHAHRQPDSACRDERSNCGRSVRAGGQGAGKGSSDVRLHPDAGGTGGPRRTAGGRRVGERGRGGDDRRRAITYGAAGAGVGGAWHRPVLCLHGAAQRRGDGPGDR